MGPVQPVDRGDVQPDDPGPRGVQIDPSRVRRGQLQTRGPPVRHQCGGQSRGGGIFIHIPRPQPRCHDASDPGGVQWGNVGCAQNLPLGQLPPARHQRMGQDGTRVPVRGSGPNLMFRAGVSG